MKRIFLCILCFLLLLNTGCVQDRIVEERETITPLEKQTVNNTTNNLIANDYSAVSVVGGTIYFMADEDDNTNLYEVSSDNSKIIYSEETPGPEDLLDGQLSSKYLTLNYVLDDKILRYAESDTYIDTETGKLVESENTYTPDPKYSYDAYIIDNQRYFFSVDEVYRYQDGEYKLLFSDSGNYAANSFNLDLKTTYINGNDFYTVMLSADGMYIIHYNFEKQKELGRVKIDSSSNGGYIGVLNLIADGNDVYYTKTGVIYHANLSSGKIEEIFKTDNGMISFNYYNGVLYVNSFDLYNVNGKNGLYAIDTRNDNNVTEMVKQTIGGIYIFDNISVYYDSYDQDDNNTLYRYDLYTNDIETVFSVK